MRFARDGSVWRATRTAEGPALVHIVPQPSEGVVEGRAWGPGCHVALDGLPDLLGASDDSSGFTPRPDHWRLVQAWRQRPGWRVPRSRAVFEALAAAALQQVVTGVEARRAWSHLVRRFGEPAPGSPGHGAGPGAELFVPPGPEQWASIPSWEWLAAGVEERRRRVIQRAARCAGRLEQTVWLPPSEVMTLAELPQSRSSKFPTLGAARVAELGCVDLLSSCCVGPALVGVRRRRRWRRGCVAARRRAVLGRARVRGGGASPGCGRLSCSSAAGWGCSPRWG